MTATSSAAKSPSAAATPAAPSAGTISAGKDTDVEFRVIWRWRTDEWQKVAADGFYWVSPKRAAVKWE